MREKMRYILRLLIIIMLNVFIIALIGHSYQAVTQPKSVQTLSKIGSRGDEVRAIQEKLLQLRLYNGKTDGVFGTETAKAVRSFQRQWGLPDDGIAGPATLSALGLAPSQPSGAVADSDYQLLARLIWAEARDEPFHGQVAVGAVILNRLEHPSFPDTIAGIAYQPGAFTAMTDRQIGQPVAASAYKAAKEALNGVDPTGGAIYYYNLKKTPHERMLSRPVILTIGDYVFCA